MKEPKEPAENFMWWVVALGTVIVAVLAYAAFSAAMARQ